MNGSFNKYLWKKKIDVTEFCNGDSHFIEIREPNTAEYKELLKLQKVVDAGITEENAIEFVETFCELSKTMIVNHDFYDESESDKRLPSKEVAEFLFAKIDLAQEVMYQFMTDLPLLHGSKTK